MSESSWARRRFTTKLTVLVSEEQMRTLDNEAASAGLTRSEVIRKLIESMDRRQKK